MEYHQAVSVKIIERMLATKKYKKKSQIREHLSFLENLASELRDKMSYQKAEGSLTWETDMDAKRVKSIYNQLIEELTEMESISIHKHYSRKDLF